MENLSAEAISSVDHLHLRKMLDSISVQLNLPFLERRGKNHQHREDPISELEDVIQELTEREKELQAAVGIAKMLLENNEQLYNDYLDVYQSLEDQKGKNQHLTYQVESLSNNLDQHESKHQEINKALITAEEQVLILTAENRRLSQQVNRPKETTDSQKDSVEELKKEFQEQFKQITKYKVDLERQVKKLQEDKSKLEASNSSYQEDTLKLKSKQEKLETKNKELEDLVKELKEQTHHQQASYEQLHQKNQVYSSKVEKLEEELRLAEEARHKSLKERKESQSFSLNSELASLEEPIDEENLFAVKNLTTTHPQEVFYLRKKYEPPRKDPSEEYFTLVTQAVKMNSPYMDTICVIPTQSLYKKALDNDVPFHRWHIWIESQLNSYYIQMLYKHEINKREPLRKRLGFKS